MRACYILTGLFLGMSWLDFHILWVFMTIVSLRFAVGWDLRSVVVDRIFTIKSHKAS